MTQNWVDKCVEEHEKRLEYFSDKREVASSDRHRGRAFHLLAHSFSAV